jgi:hypothetical protein
MRKFCKDLVQFFGKKCLGERSHNRVERQSESTMERHYMEGVGRSQ